MNKSTPAGVVDLHFQARLHTLALLSVRLSAFFGHCLSTAVVRPRGVRLLQTVGSVDAVLDTVLPEYAGAGVAPAERIAATSVSTRMPMRPDTLARCPSTTVHRTRRRWGLGTRLTVTRPWTTCSPPFGA